MSVQGIDGRLKSCPIHTLGGHERPERSLVRYSIIIISNKHFLITRMAVFDACFCTVSVFLCLAASAEAFWGMAAA